MVATALLNSVGPHLVIQNHTNVINAASITIDAITIIGYLTNLVINHLNEMVVAATVEAIKMVFITFDFEKYAVGLDVAGIAVAVINDDEKLITFTNSLVIRNQVMI